MVYRTHLEQVPRAATAGASRSPAPAAQRGLVSRAGAAGASFLPPATPVRREPALPSKLLGEVFTRLDPATLAMAGAVNKAWREVARSPAVVRAVVNAARFAPEPQTHLFVHPERNVLFHLGRSNTLRVASLDDERFSTRALGQLPGHVRERWFSAQGNLVALRASGTSRVDIFDLRRDPQTRGAYFLAAVMSDDFVFVGEEPRLLELDLAFLHVPTPGSGSSSLVRQPIVAQPTQWHELPTAKRATRDGAWGASWVSDRMEPHGGPEVCFFRVANPENTMRVCGANQHAYGNVAFDREGHRAAALFLDRVRNEVGLYLVDLRTMTRGPDIWTGRPFPVAPGWPMTFSDDGADLVIEEYNAAAQAFRPALWLADVQKAAGSLRPLHAAPRFGARRVHLTLAGRPQRFYVDEATWV